MKPNPGGQIDPRDVMGRDALIERLWATLRQQSVALLAERRMGKTCITKKMTAECPRGVLPVWQELEGAHSPLEFVEAVFHEVDRYLSRWNRAAGRVHKLLGQVSGGAVAGIKFPAAAAGHWKALFLNMMEDLAEHQQDMVVFFWDELPMMLKNIKDRHGEETAMELLDAMRSIRQSHDRIRMFFTGSIGLHNVLTSLKQSGHPSAPINDMHVEDLSPLALPDAMELARRLLKGEGLLDGLTDSLPKVIAQEVDRIPYYIHHVVSQMARSHTEPTPEAVRQLVTGCLTSDQDLWEMDHFLSRVDVYYDKGDQAVVLGLLDVLAGAKEPLSFTRVFSLLKSQVPTDDREDVRRLLKLLRRDHYLTMDKQGLYRFRYPLIQRWWRLERGLPR